MSAGNRELSQFGSFIFIEDSTKSIGIATTATPYVGMGTTNPQAKLHVVGDVIIDGALSFDGTLDIGSNDVITTGIISAAQFLDIFGNVLTNFDSWTQDNENIYRLGGNIGLGTSTLTEKLQVIGNVSANKFISTVTSGTAPLEVSSTTEVANLNASLLRGGIPGSNVNSFDIVTLGAQQTLSNKVLNIPAVSGLGVTFNGSSSGRTTVRANATAPNNTLTLPTTNGTLVSTGDTGVITSNMIADFNITNNDIAVGAGISYSKLFLTNFITNADIASNANIDITKLSARTISGVSLGSTLSALSPGSFVNFSGGSSYTGAAPISVSIAATSASTGNTIVSRNASGDFSAGTLTVTNINASQTVQANAFIGDGSQLTGIDADTFDPETDSINTTGIVTARELNATDGIKINGVTINNTGIVTARELNVIDGISVNGVTVIDGDGNINAGIATFSYVSPHPILLSPANGAVNQNVDVNIVITFNQPVEKGTGNITLRSGSATGTIIQTIDVTSGNVTISDTIVTINPPNNLPANANIFVVIDAGALKSVIYKTDIKIVGHNFITINSITPPNDSTNVGVSTNITIAFDSPPTRGTGTITIRTGSATGTILESFDAATSNRISISGNNWIIDPTDILDYGESIFLVIPDTAIVDYPGLNIAGTNTYSFQTIPLFLGAPYEGGFFICQSGGTRWVVAPSTSEVRRTWYCRDDAVIRAQEVSGCTEWFVPTRTQLQNPGYSCRVYWDSYNTDTCLYWSSTQDSSSCAFRVSFSTGQCVINTKSTPSPVRAFRCVTY